LTVHTIKFIWLSGFHCCEDSYPYTRPWHSAYGYPLTWCHNPDNQHVLFNSMDGTSMAVPKCWCPK